MKLLAGALAVTSLCVAIGCAADGDGIVRVSGGELAERAAPLSLDSDAPPLVVVPLADGAPLGGAPAMDFLRLARGEQLAVVRADGTLELVAPDGTTAAGTAAATSIPTVLRLDVDVIRGLSSSADGSRLAYAKRTDGPETDVLVTDLGGGGPPAIVTGWIGSEAEPALSPDGMHVAFVSGRTGIASVWVAPARAGGGEEALQLTNAGLGRAAGTPGLAPSGFVPPPEGGSLRWASPGLITWEAGGRSFTVEVAR